jgi:hypothetical protein
MNRFLFEHPAVFLSVLGVIIILIWILFKRVENKSNLESQFDKKAFGKNTEVHYLIHKEGAK